MKAVSAFFSEAVAAYGFTASAGGAFVPSSNGPEPRFFFQNWPADWLAIYQSRNFVAHDFGVAEARRRVFPFVWSEALSERQLSAGEQRVWDAVLAFGWKDGFSVPIHGPGGYLAIITMATAHRPIEDDARIALHMLSLLTHERCRALTDAGNAGAGADRLSARELECLRWVSAGKSDAEIGVILDVSPSTVKFHINNGRKKLGVRTRAQAISRLVLGGLS